MVKPYGSGKGIMRQSSEGRQAEMSMSTSAKLIFLCGKMAAGKSTLARDLAIQENAVLLVQDDFLNALFPGEITDIPSFVNRYTRLKNALTPHICVLLLIERVQQNGAAPIALRGLEEDLRRPRFRSRHEDTEGMVSRADRAHTC
jgi:AAA domain